MIFFIFSAVFAQGINDISDIVSCKTQNGVVACEIIEPNTTFTPAPGLSSLCPEGWTSYVTGEENIRELGEINKYYAALYSELLTLDLKYNPEGLTKRADALILEIKSIELKYVEGTVSNINDYYDYMKKVKEYNEIVMKINQYSKEVDFLKLRFDELDLQMGMFESRMRATDSWVDCVNYSNIYKNIIQDGSKN